MLGNCKKNVNTWQLNECGVLFAHEMARMRFDDQPHLAAGGELQGIAGSQGEVDFHLDSAFYPSADDYIAQLERDDAAGNYVARA